MGRGRVQKEGRVPMQFNLTVTVIVVLYLLAMLFIGW